MTRRSVATVKPPRKRALLDLFGEVPVTRDDVYAWLLAVVDLDPASFRAFDYVRLYGVLNKIVQAKLAGTFDEMTRPARFSARFRELQAQGRASDAARNTLGLGEAVESEPEPLLTKSLKAKARPREVIRAERHERAERARVHAQLRGSPLNRMPKSMPTLSLMLEDLGNPTPAMLAHVLGVSSRDAAKWIKTGDAPKLVAQALFWMTRWGMSEADCLARNDAIAKASEAAVLRAEVDRLRAQLQVVGRISEFGSANDPLPSVRARHHPAETAAAVPPGADADEGAAPLPPGEQEAGALRRTAQGGAAQGGRGAARPAAEERPRRGPEASSYSDDTGGNACAA